MSDSTEPCGEAVQRPADAGCICAGNWRALVDREEHRIGRRFRDRRGDEWTFFGLVHGDDDYYFGMDRLGQVALLSCVGGIEDHGYEALP